MDLITAALNNRDDNIARLEKRVAALRDALNFYANEWGYDYDETMRPVKTNKTDILGDSGYRAQQALEKDEANATD